MLQAMRFRYERAVNALQMNASEVSDSDPISRQPPHALLRNRRNDKLDDTLLTSFFAKANPALKAQTIGDVGWHFGQEGTSDLDETIKKRLMHLWEHRLAQRN